MVSVQAGTRDDAEQGLGARTRLRRPGVVDRHDQRAELVSLAFRTDRRPVRRIAERNPCPLPFRSLACAIQQEAA